jgi:hypothetical protein
MIPLSNIGSTDVYMIGEGRVERIRLDVQCAQPFPRVPDRSNIVIVEVRRKRAHFDLAKTAGELGVEEKLKQRLARILTAAQR